MTDNRVMVFIDGSNLYKRTKSLINEGNQVDIKKLTSKLLGKRKLERIYYYNTYSPSEDPEVQKAQQKFLEVLGWIDYLQKRMGRLIPKEYTVKCPNSACGTEFTFKTHIQKGVDTRMAVDMVTFAVSDAYDIAILLSGDEDLVEAVDYVREHTSKKVENSCVPGPGWSRKLREAADIKIPLTKEYLKDCLVK